MDRSPSPEHDGVAPAATLDEAALRSALGGANIPVLLVMLAQLTGDDRWLEPPYAPTRTRGMDDNDSGGLPEPLQQEIRTAALAAIVGAAGRDGLPDAPSEALLAKLISTCMGEPVPIEYSAMMLEEMQLRPRQPEWDEPPPADRLAAFRVLIVGAGISGVCAAVSLSHLGVPYTVIEKNDSVGGTWLENRYPGCGVDTPSHLYSYSFAPHNWSRFFAKRDEIRAYIEDVADRYGIHEHVLFGTSVEDARFEEATGEVVVTARRSDGEIITLRGNALISAVGQLNEPSVPHLPGAERFEGPAFHSARWPADVDVTGKRVAVIGTGASAMQIVPAIADKAESVTVYQRSPQWAVPSTNYQREVPDGVRYLMEHVPLYAAWYRCRLVWSFSDKVYDSLHVDPEWPDQEHSINAINDGHRRYFTKYLVEQLGERQDLLPRLLPEYPPFAKRMLIDNSWFTTMAKRNVELVVDGIETVVEDGIVDRDGQHRPADIVVYATGFQTLRMVGSYDIFGRDGQSLRDTWGEDDAFAYLGITVPRFPNVFFLYGPNTALGHGGSVILLTECGVRYTVRLLQRMIVDGLRAVECRTEVSEEYTREVDAAHEQMIWRHPGATNWYRNRRGRVVTNSPWRVLDYWRMTHEPNLADFVVTPAGDRSPAPG